ncbi:MAG TPA: hypothetical protein VF368_01520 [Gemmatimonadaceae bacterium]
MSTARTLFTTPSRLIAHSRYVLQDYLLLRASLPLVFVSFVAWIIVRQFARSAGPRQWADPHFLQAIHSTYGNMAAVLMYFTVFLAVVAVMAVDRTTGYFRFFFSKPVNVVWYYLHTFCVHGAAVCTLLVVFALAWGTAMPHESLQRALYLGIIAFALIGGLGFGFGALTNADAALTPLSFVFAISTQSALLDSSIPPRWLVVVARTLPPAVALEKTRALLNGAGPFLGAPLWHVLAYGAGGWVLGLIFLRARPLAR